jgi:hypothetical protein
MGPVLKRVASQQFIQTELGGGTFGKVLGIQPSGG